MSQQKQRHSSGTKPATPTGPQTRAALLQRAGRKAVPLRKVFVQLPQGSPSPRHGMLAPFATAGDLRGMRAYLMVLAASSGQGEGGRTTELDSLVWARLFDVHLHAEDSAARTAAWRTLLRLQTKQLLTCTRTRGSRRISVTLLREDGSGAPYTRPGVTDKDAYLQLPLAFWLKGFDGKMTMPSLAMLLTVCSARSWEDYPAERMPDWYGWSADTTERGLKTLLELNLIERRPRFKSAPLTPTGATKFYEYRPARIMRVSAKAKAAAPTTTAGASA
ncbi:hypothetical protein Daura_06135 [Dactylosporangium aurantiacum]|uniref:Uncharacterized protein n=1 Tax=Dactylosporangium aurantiacum TaxID=35754 RepID=A0A9Q9MIE6_9ACTN|nr:hypothetical protein [Dactylosporangium aurantiacum]MDG6108814.1 hypothetical protein [Dactylosporangium aurantiacum]UWZ55780.1 hypothetical protein Daura_06135 [Dactylosporangium aurantiacum]